MLSSTITNPIKREKYYISLSILYSRTKDEINTPQGFPGDF
jgi:hypothetical protein